MSDREYLFGLYLDNGYVDLEGDSIGDIGRYRVLGQKVGDFKHVVVGNGRNNQLFNRDNWNRLVDLVGSTDPQLDQAKLLVIDQFMGSSLYDGEYSKVFLEAIKDGRLPKIE